MLRPAPFSVVMEAAVTMPTTIAIAIVARIEMGVGDGIIVKPSDWHKCGRCWRLLPEVPEDGALCRRCDNAVAELDPA